MRRIVSKSLQRLAALTVLSATVALLVVPQLPPYPPVCIDASRVPRRLNKICLSYPEVSLGAWLVLRARELPVIVADGARSLNVSVPPVPVFPSRYSDAGLAIVVCLVLGWTIRGVRAQRVGELRSLREISERLSQGTDSARGN